MVAVRHLGSDLGGDKLLAEERLVHVWEGSGRSDGSLGNAGAEVDAAAIAVAEEGLRPLGVGVEVESGSRILVKVAG